MSLQASSVWIRVGLLSGVLITLAGHIQAQPITSDQSAVSQQNVSRTLWATQPWLKGHINPAADLSAPAQSGLSSWQIPVNNEDVEKDSGQGRYQAEQTLLSIKRSLPELVDPLVTNYLDSVARRLAWQTGQPLRALVVVNSPEINAFATPGGVIAVNRGLIYATRREDELAAVIAHELAHVVQHHVEAREAAARRSRWIGLGSALASIAIGKAAPELATATALGGQAASVNQMLAFSREQERDADRQGMSYLLAAGYDAQAMPDFLKQLQEQTRQVGFMPGFLLTHPLTTERVSEAQSRVMQLKSVKRAMTQGSLFDWMRVRALILGKQAGWNTQANASEISSSAKQYGQALIYQMRQQYPQAQQSLTQLMQRNDLSADQRRWAQLLQIELLGAQGQAQNALQQAEQLAVLYPDQNSVRWVLGETLNANQQYLLALTTLYPITERQPYDAVLWSQLAEIAPRLPADFPQRDALSLYLRSQAQWWNGETRAAWISINQASRAMQGKSPRVYRNSQLRGQAQQVATEITTQLPRLISQQLNQMESANAKAVG